MSDETFATDAAVEMMSWALTLLDAAGEQLAATRLQHVLDTVRPASKSFQSDDTS